MDLLSTNTKSKKSDKGGWKVLLLQLAPAKVSGYNVCPASKPNKCADDCIFYAGYGQMPNVQASRIKRTRLYFEDRPRFLELLDKDLYSASKLGKKIAVRLNCFSDLDFREVVARHPEIQFYDYTKVKRRLTEPRPENYHLTWSYGPAAGSQNVALNYLERGGNVAVAFQGDLPPTWWGHTVIDGDEDDKRFLDPAGVVVGLRAKGTGKKSTSPFFQKGGV